MFSDMAEQGGRESNSDCAIESDSEVLYGFEVQRQIAECCVGKLKHVIDKHENMLAKLSDIIGNQHPQDALQFLQDIRDEMRGTKEVSQYLLEKFSKIGFMASDTENLVVGFQDEIFQLGNFIGQLQIDNKKMQNDLEAAESGSGMRDMQRSVDTLESQLQAMQREIDALRESEYSGNIDSPEPDNEQDGEYIEYFTDPEITSESELLEEHDDLANEEAIVSEMEPDEIQ